MINAVIAGMVSVLLNIYFIKIWGLLGAGVAVLVSYLVSAFLNFTYKVKGVDNVDFKRFFKVFIYAILIGFITCSLINVLLKL